MVLNKNPRVKGQICRATKSKKKEIARICKRNGKNSKPCKDAKSRFC